MRERWLRFWNDSELLRGSGGSEHFFCIEVLDLRLIAHHLAISRFQQLLFAVLQLGAAFLLHARVGEITLPRRFHENQLDDAERAGLLGGGVDQRNDWGVLNRPELLHCLAART